ncbi:MAG: hypothetical protein N2C14_32055 [Planctomycetales bacterium]
MSQQFIHGVLGDHLIILRLDAADRLAAMLQGSASATWGEFRELFNSWALLAVLLLAGITELPKADEPLDPARVLEAFRRGRLLIFGLDMMDLPPELVDQGNILVSRDFGDFLMIPRDRASAAALALPDRVAQDDALIAACCGPSTLTQPSAPRLAASKPLDDPAPSAAGIADLNDRLARARCLLDCPVDSSKLTGPQCIHLWGFLSGIHVQSLELWGKLLPHTTPPAIYSRFARLPRPGSLEMHPIFLKLIAVPGLLSAAGLPADLPETEELTEARDALRAIVDMCVKKCDQLW